MPVRSGCHYLGRNLGRFMECHSFYVLAVATNVEARANQPLPRL